MIVRLGTSLVTAFVLYCLLFDVTSIYFSVTKSKNYEPTPNPTGIGMVISAQPQNGVISTSFTSQHEVQTTRHISRIFSNFATKLRNAFRNFRSTLRNLFRKKEKVKALPIDQPSPQKKHHPVEKGRLYPKSWGGSPITDKEKEGLDYIETMRKSYSVGNGISAWLHNATSTDLLRFLRARNGNAQEAFKNILTHAKWRTTEYGADTILQENRFKGSAMNREVFWLGISSTNCPTLVVRTQAHDGADYNEDPKIFTSFMVSVIEEGISKYGIGTSRQVCVLLDRSPYLKSGVKKKEDMSVIPNLVKLFQHLYSTIIENYPDLLLTAQIVPASWFFSVCYKITSRVMDHKTRAKFQTVKAENVFEVMGKLFSSENLPPHLGGTCALYGPNPIESGAVSTAPALVRSTHIAQEPVSSSGDKDKDKVESKNFLHIVQLEVHSTESTVQGLSQSRGNSAGGSLEQVNDKAPLQERVNVVGIDVAVSGLGTGQGVGVGVAQSGSSRFRGSGGDMSSDVRGRERGRGEEPLGSGGRGEPRNEREKGHKASLQVAPSCLHMGSGNDQKVCSDKIDVVNRVSVTRNSIANSPNNSLDSSVSSNSNHMAGNIKFEGSAAESALDDWSSIWT